MDISLALPSSCSAQKECAQLLFNIASSHHVVRVNMALEHAIFGTVYSFFVCLFVFLLSPYLWHPIVMEVKKNEVHKHCGS